MSIGIAIAVPDGIALAADSQTTWTRAITKVKEKQTNKEIELANPISIPVGWSKMARKLFSINMNATNFAIITAGEAQLNSKTMFAVFRSAAKQYSGDGLCSKVSTYLVEHLKKELAQQFSCKTEDLKKQQVKVCKFILAGYEDKDVAKPFLESHLVFSGSLTINQKKNTKGHFLKWSNLKAVSRYGGCWIGQTDFISHVVNHLNKKLPPISGQYSLMTLVDAVEYTNFLINFTCDFQRFAIMVPNCGKPIISATLTPESYEENIIKENV